MAMAYLEQATFEARVDARKTSEVQVQLRCADMDQPAA